MKCVALGRMPVECGRCNTQGSQGAPSALGRQIFFADVFSKFANAVNEGNWSPGFQLGVVFTWFGNKHYF